MISTTCESCKFRTSSDKVQIGCRLDLLDRFREAGAEITMRESEGLTSFVVNRVCPSRRNMDWEGDLYTETFIPTTIVVLHEGPIANLKQSLYCIKHLSGPKRPRVIVCHWDDPEGVAKAVPSDALRIHMIEEAYTNAAYDEAFKRCKNGWVIFTKSGDHLEPETLEILNFAINYRMGTFISVEGLIEAYMAVPYKYLRGQMGGSVKEKIRELGPGSIANWGDLDEDYWLFYD